MTLLSGHHPFFNEKVLIRGVTSLEEDNLLVLYYLSASYICPNKWGDLMIGMTFGGLISGVTFCGLISGVTFGDLISGVTFGGLICGVTFGGLISGVA